jgi:LCP family protein required for cell wall assembly
MGGSPRKRIWIGGVFVIVLALAAGAVFVASTWSEVNRVSIDRPASVGGEAAAAPETEESPDEQPGSGVTLPPAGDGIDVFLMVGSDSRDSLADTEGFGEFDGQRADVVMVLMRPHDNQTAAVLSLPRDLLVDDVCSDQKHRLNDALQGCPGVLNGPTALTVTVESLIGVAIDHFAMVDLGGFQHAVDAVGGYEICLELPVRDPRANLELPAGCIQATGEQTLAWLRSRTTQELTDDGWRVVPGVNDLTRNERQREFMISILGRLSDFSSPQDVASVANSVAPYVTVDSSLTLIDAIGLAWTMRGLGDDSIRVLEVPVADAVTDFGAAVLVPTVDISDVVMGYLTPEVSRDSALFQAG